MSVSPDLEPEREALAAPVKAGPVYALLLRLMLGVVPGMIAADLWVGWWTKGQSEEGSDQSRLEDPYLGWRPEPHFENPKFGTRLDRYGMRSPEIPDDAPRDEVRILATGASRLYGAGGAQQKDLWNYVLQRRLDQEAPGRYRVLNGAVMAYSVVQATHRAMELIDQVQPDLVFLEATPGAELMLDMSSARNYVHFGSELVPRDVIDGWPEWTVPGVLRVHQALLHSNIYERYRRIQTGNVDRPREMQKWVLSSRSDLPAVREIAERTFEELGQLAEKCRERGVELRVLTSVEYYQGNDARWREFVAKNQPVGAPPIGTPRLEGVRLLQERLHALGIGTWDVSAEIELFETDRKRFLMDVGHWSAEGHLVIARAIYKGLKDEGLLESLAAARAARPR